jgi:hypothetical protein
MKTVLIIAAIVGFSSSAAWAECAGHRVNASNEVDKEMTTASISKTSRVPQVNHAEDEQTPARDGQDVGQQ